MNQTDTPGSTTTRVITSILLSLAILAAGAGGFFLLKHFRKVPEVQIPHNPGPLVTVTIVRAIDKTITVHGFGTVRAKVNVQLIPQVSGRVIDLHPDMVDGGYFRAGETLITIDPRDYELAVQQAQAANQ
ncbi:MAG: biotin/lipoyl-binding protein, partial [Planctomycetes bacterium]|nr:biotin/lipoyl-binding protein [Planctomycetota bacterium]